MEAKSANPEVYRINLELVIANLRTQHAEKIEELSDIELNSLIEILFDKFEPTIEDIPAHTRRTKAGYMMKLFINFIPNEIDQAIKEVLEQREGITKTPEFHHLPEKAEAEKLKIPVHLQCIAVSVAIAIVITLVTIYGPDVLEQSERSQALKMLRHNYSLLQIPFNESEFTTLDSKELWEEVASTSRLLDYNQANY